jgi:hypothetical protein
VKRYQIILILITLILIPSIASASSSTLNNLNLLMGYPIDFSNWVQYLNNHIANQMNTDVTPIHSDNEASSISTIQATPLPTISPTLTPTPLPIYTTTSTPKPQTVTITPSPTITPTSTTPVSIATTPGPTLSLPSKESEEEYRKYVKWAQSRPNNGVVLAPALYWYSAIGQQPASQKPWLNETLP